MSFASQRELQQPCGRERGVNPECGVILELTGAEPEKYMLPPLVCLGQYRVEYGGELSLAAALLKELQGG